MKNRILNRNLLLFFILVVFVGVVCQLFFCTRHVDVFVQAESDTLESDKVTTELSMEYHCFSDGSKYGSEKTNSTRRTIVRFMLL